MMRDVVMDIFRRIPESEHPKVQLVMRSGPMLSVETILRYEPAYMLMRGREAGNQDDGRAFFVPYEEITSIKIEASVKLSDLETWYSDRPSIDRQEAPAASKLIHETTAPVSPEEPVSMDPAQIAKKNLLDRIRATRTSVNAGKTANGKG